MGQPLWSEFFLTNPGRQASALIHFDLPPTTRPMFELINGVRDKLQRELTWIHMPVPQNRDDDGYFEPLTGLHCSATTEVYLVWCMVLME